MKRLIFSITMFLGLLLAANGQDQNDQFRTVFGDDGQNIEYGGYGALVFGYTRIDGRDAMLSGIKGGWMINHRVTLGIAGYGFVNDLTYDNIYENQAVNLAGGYGGLLIEPVILPFNPVHITVPLLVGAGGIAYIDSFKNNNGGYYQDPQVRDSDVFFVFEPGLEVEFNLVKFMRLAVGGSYRYTSNIGLTNTDGQVLRGFNANISLKFGKF